MAEEKQTDGETMAKLAVFLEKHEHLNSRVEDHHTTLYGSNGNFGVSQKVVVMWRVHVWLLCSVSAAVGYLIKLWIK
jgi:hypothetical protein